jgi:hypothetical protein
LIRGVGFEISVPQHNIWQKTLKMRVVEHAWENESSSVVLHKTM